MDANIENKLKLMLQGHLKYTSDNLAFNMLIKKLQRKIEENPESIDICIEEIDIFADKYSKIVATDFARIAAL
ncbi:MAG: hypothetical protein IK071_04120 [Lachnospiraceae bacterium]|nr:hypothetical protein [Lachnospiraceae bacterium]